MDGTTPNRRGHAKWSRLAGIEPALLVCEALPIELPLAGAGFGPATSRHVRQPLYRELGLQGMPRTMGVRAVSTTACGAASPPDCQNGLFRYVIREDTVIIPTGKTVFKNWKSAKDGF